jgi:hypothetical protein
MLTKNSRVFTFGCSFTEFPWPTWADIVIEHAENDVLGVWGENWGQSGAGNLFIASRIWECHAKNNLTPEDYVFVCWSSINREDRYVDGRWRTHGLLNSDVYNKDFIEKYSSNSHGALRDCTLIKSTQLALKQLGIHSTHFSMIGLIQEDSRPWFPFFTGDESDKIVRTHNIEFDGKPMMEVLGLKDQSPKQGRKRIQTNWINSEVKPEWHPTPMEHQQYLEQEIISKVDFLQNGINSSAKNLVTKYMDFINSHNGKPIELDPRYTKWKPKTITNKW